MSDRNNLETIGSGIEKTAKWAIIFALFPQIKKIIVEMFRGIKIITLIFFHGSKNITEDTLSAVKAARWGILIITGLTLLVANVLTAFGAGCQNRVLMALAGLVLIVPLSIIAASGQAIAYLIGLYLTTIEGTLKGFRAILVKIAEKLGVELEDDVPTPEFINREKVASGVGRLWYAVILVFLVYAFCVAFPSFKAWGMGFIITFAFIGLNVMVSKFNETNAEEDAKKVIPIVKSQRRIYKLVSLGLTILLIFTALSIMFSPDSKNPVAKSVGSGIKETEKAAAAYIDSANGLHNLPKKIVVDVYEATIAPLLEKPAEETVVHDSSITKTGIVLEFAEKQLQFSKSPAILYFRLSSWLYQAAKEKKPVFVEVDGRNPYTFDVNDVHDHSKREGLIKLPIPTPTSKIRFFTPDNRFLRGTLTKLQDGSLFWDGEELRGSEMKKAMGL